MTTLNIALAVFALFMLFRNVRGARALLRRETRGRPMALVSALNVGLAIVLLGIAVRGLVTALSPR